jgi:hypothetical protein
MTTTAASAQAPHRDVLQAMRELTGLVAGAAVLAYLTGGLAIQLSLGAVGLPSSAAVPQLPREFLISTGLLIVAPAVAVAALVAWATNALGVRPARSWMSRRSRRRWRIAATVATGVACYLAVGALVVSKDPFPARVCLQEGSVVDGVLIGETNDRTYLGEPAGTHPRRVISIPESQIARVVVGGRERQLGAVRCPAAAT